MVAFLPASSFCFVWPSFTPCVLSPVPTGRNAAGEGGGFAVAFAATHLGNRCYYADLLRFFLTAGLLDFALDLVGPLPVAASHLALASAFTRIA